jgi:hypothetical protein
MGYRNIVALCAAAAAIGAAASQEFGTPARAAAPIVRASYQGLGSGVNETVAVLWLLGSDGGLKICTHAATGNNADAPVCSAAVTP